MSKILKVAFFGEQKIVLTLILIEVIIFIIAFLIMKKKYPYKSAKNHGFIIASIVLAIAIIYALEQYAHFKKIDSWIAIADNILSGSIFVAFCLFFSRFEKKIKNQCEDSEKLRQDYKELSEKYKKNSLITAISCNNSKIIYPIINMGKGCISLKNEENESVTIIDSEHDYYELPSIIEQHFLEIFSAHDTSNIYNNLNIRVKSMCIKNNQLEMQTERTTYYNSLVTNRASDYKLTEGVSVRELFETGPKMTSLKYSKLSNHLGFNGFVESSDGYIVFVKRSDSMSIGKGTYGDSIGASLKVKYAIDENDSFNYKGLRRAIINEIFDELKISEENINLDTLCIFAAYRDCVECGKPQLLIYAKSTKTASEITSNFTKERKEKYSNKKKILDKKQKQELNALEDGTKLIWIKKETLINEIIYNYDGIELSDNIILKEKKKWKIKKEGFVSFNKNRKQLLIKKLKMVPSASATIYLFKELNMTKLQEK